MSNGNMDFTEVPIENNMVDEVKPCRKTMNRALIGMVLSAFTLNFLWLNYILPVIGIVLMLLDFRSLRRENSSFRACWIISIIRAVYIISWLIINATIWQKTILESSIAETLNYIHMVLIFIQIIFMGIGFRTVQKKAGIKPHAGSITAFLVWYILLCALGLIQYSGFIMPMALIISFILIIRGFNVLISKLDGTRYSIAETPSGISDKAVILGISLVLMLGIAVADIFFSKYPMQWIPVAYASSNEAEAIKEHLVSLGFPDTIVDDLTEDDLLDCTGAIRVIVQEQDYTMYNPELSITGIAVELPGDTETWKLFHHFNWNKKKLFCGTEAILLWPTCRVGEGWKMKGKVSGRVLYDDNGQTYASPYYSLGNVSYEQEGFFRGISVPNDTFAEFSFPNGKIYCRGYVSYKILEAIDGYMIDSWFNYVHQKSWLQYPAQTAINWINQPITCSDKAFWLIQNQLQFKPNDDNFNLLRSTN